MRLTHLHVFPFSPRPGTPAARMPQLSRQLVKERGARLRAKGDEVLNAYLASEVGKVRPVLIERKALGAPNNSRKLKFPAGSLAKS